MEQLGTGTTYLLCQTPTPSHSSSAWISASYPDPAMQSTLKYATSIYEKSTEAYLPNQRNGDFPTLCGSSNTLATQQETGIPWKSATFPLIGAQP